MRMVFRKRLLVLLTLVSVLGFAYTGAVQAEEVTLRVAHCHGGQTEELWKAQLAEFEKANPGIKVEYEVWPWPMIEQILVSAAGGAMPDIFYVFGAAYQKNAPELMLNLTPYMERDGVEAKDYFVSDAPRGSVGELYALPYDASFWLSTYNKELLDDAGLVEPGTDFSVADLLDIFRKVSRDVDGDGINDIVGLNSIHTGWFSESYTVGFGASWIKDGKVTADSPEMRNAWNFWSNAVAQGYVEPTLSAMWEEGRSAIRFTDNSWVTQWSNPETGVKFRWGTAPLPTAAGVEKQGRSGAGLFSIAKQTKHPDEAWELLKYLTGPEASAVRAEKEGWFPGHAGAIPAYATWLRELANVGGNPPDPYMPIMEAVRLGKPQSYMTTGHFLDIDGIVAPHLDAMLTAGEAVGTTLSNIQREVEAFLEKTQ